MPNKQNQFKSLIVTVLVLAVIGYMVYNRTPGYREFDNNLAELIPPEAHPVFIEVLRQGKLKVETRVAPHNARINIYVINLADIRPADYESLDDGQSPLSVTPTVAKRLNTNVAILNDIDVEAGKYAIMFESADNGMESTEPLRISYVLSALD